jgi:hypothetical protein
VSPTWGIRGTGLVHAAQARAVNTADTAHSLHLNDTQSVPVKARTLNTKVPFTAAAMLFLFLLSLVSEL